MRPDWIAYFFVSWWWKRITLGHNYILCFTFMCQTKKAPRNDILYPVPYWVHECVPHNITILLLALDMCKPEYYGYASSWCKFHIEIYDLSKFSISMVSANYKVNWNDCLIFVCLFVHHTGYLKGENTVSLSIPEVNALLSHTLILVIFICSVICLHIPCS